MILPRFIPCLLLRGRGLVKGIRFRDHVYVGDPINTVQIFNTKQVDELLFLDISATAEKRIPSLELVQQIADQCVMPFGVGGGIRSVDHVRAILSAGAEKVCICTAATEGTSLVREASRAFGSQAIVVSIDCKKTVSGKTDVMRSCGTKSAGLDPLDFALRMQDAGAGEILLNSVDRDGTMQGYDLELIQTVAGALTIPVIACGGAGAYSHLADAVRVGKAAAAAAGSLFVFHGRKRAVLVNYPDDSEHERLLEGSQVT